MRYLIDREFRPPVRTGPTLINNTFSLNLRRELSERNVTWARSRNHAHEVSLGIIPAVLYREDESGVHGNFIRESYEAIRTSPQWMPRLAKVHTSARRSLLSRDRDRRELDSSNSSDALLMNVFCHPQTFNLLSVRALLAIDGDAEAIFGYRPGVAFKNGRRDRTEIDLKLGSLLIEAKLTEAGFQTAPKRMVERYRDFDSIFFADLLDLDDGYVSSYQLIRGILAVVPSKDRFCVLCDARRTDLIDAWHRVMMAVKSHELRCRLQLLTWQELAECLSLDLRNFLYEKFGISSGGMGSGSK